MKYDFDDLYEGPRFQNRTRRRKIKLIITGIASIIGITLLIIVFNIFSGEKQQVDIALEDTNDTELEDTNSGLDHEPETVTDIMDEEEEFGNQVELEDLDVSNNTQGHSDESDTIIDEDTVIKNNKEIAATEDEATSTPTPVTEVNEDSFVLGTIQKDWKPVGTSQQGEHYTDYTKDSTDWNEMTEAVSVATGLSKDNMIVWWMGNGGGPDKAVSTISTKDQQTYYRIQLEWVDNKGWKPILVEQLKENDHKPESEETATETSTTTPLDDENPNNSEN